MRPDVSGCNQRQYNSSRPRFGRTHVAIFVQWGLGCCCMVLWIAATRVHLHQYNPDIRSIHRPVINPKGKGRQSDGTRSPSVPLCYVSSETNTRKFAATRWFPSASRDVFCAAHQSEKRKDAVFLEASSSPVSGVLRLNFREFPASTSELDWRFFSREQHGWHVAIQGIPGNLYSYWKACMP